MQSELEQVFTLVADWPPELQQKIIDAIRAIQAEYIDGEADSF